MSTRVHDPQAPERAQNHRVHELVSRVEAGGIYLGVWGCPQGKQETFTRRAWLEAAAKKQLLTGEEQGFLRRHWARLLDWALDD